MEIGLEGNLDKNVVKVGKKLVFWRGNFKIWKKWIGNRYIGR